MKRPKEPKKPERAVRRVEALDFCELWSRGEDKTEVPWQRALDLVEERRAALPCDAETVLVHEVDYDYYSTTVECRYEDDETRAVNAERQQKYAQQLREYEEKLARWERLQDMQRLAEEDPEAFDRVTVEVHECERDR